MAEDADARPRIMRVIRRKQEVSAKPNMFNPATREYQWKVIPGEPYPHKAEFQPRREIPDKILTSSPPLSSRNAASSSSYIPFEEQPQHSPDVRREPIAAAVHLEPIPNPPQPLVQQLSFPLLPVTSHALPPLNPSNSVIPQQNSDGYGVQQFWGGNDDLRRIISRNVDEAQHSFLKWHM